jgi:hypothetical protein
VHRQINNREGHNQLQDDLVEHLWEFHGRQRRQSSFIFSFLIIFLFLRYSTDL